MKIPVDQGITSNIHVITEGIHLHGKTRASRTWDLDATLLPSYEVTKLPRSRDSKRQDSHATAYVPKEGAPLPMNADAAIRPALSLYERTEIARKQRKYGSAYRSPDALQPCTPAVGQERSRVAGAHGHRVEKRVKVEVMDAATGESRTIYPVFVKYTVMVKAYGTVFTFESSNRAKSSFLDSRDGCRKPLSFAKAELVRLLGAEAGAAQFSALTGGPAPESPTVTCNPATKKPLSRKKRNKAVHRRISRHFRNTVVRCGPPTESSPASMAAAADFDAITSRFQTAA